MRLKVSSWKWRPFCLGLNVLRDAHVPGQPHRSSSLCRRLKTMRPFSPSLANLASRGKPDLFCWIYFVFDKKTYLSKSSKLVNRAIKCRSQPQSWPSPCICPSNYGARASADTQVRPRENGRRFGDDNPKRIFLNENVRISIKISLKFVPKGPINNNPSLVQIMAWRRSGDKLFSEPMMVRLLTHICVTRPQWVNQVNPFSSRIPFIIRDFW